MAKKRNDLAQKSNLGTTLTVMVLFALVAFFTIPPIPAYGSNLPRGEFPFMFRGRDREEIREIMEQWPGIRPTIVRTGNTDDSGRPRWTITRFSEVISHSGEVEHEQLLSLYRGSSKLAALGVGVLGGNLTAGTLESLKRNAFSATENYYLSTLPAATAAGALKAESAYSISGELSARSAVNLQPGGSAAVQETAARSVEPSGSSAHYSNILKVEGGTARLSAEMAGAGASFDVEGSSRSILTVTQHSGGKKAGWWDLP